MCAILCSCVHTVNGKRPKLKEIFFHFFIINFLVSLFGNILSGFLGLEIKVVLLDKPKLQQQKLVPFPN